MNFFNNNKRKIGFNGFSFNFFIKVLFCEKENFFFCNV